MPAKTTDSVSVPMPAPKVSVLMPVYNAKPFLEDTVKSLLGQSLTDFELIMVLDCPTDGSDVIARRLAESDSRIRVIANTERQHIGMSRNAALSMARAPYVCFVDHDDRCHRQMLELLYGRALANDADAVLSVVQTDVSGDATNGIRPSDELMKLSSKKSDRDRIVADLLTSGLCCSRRESLFNTVVGSLYRTSLAREVGFIDTRFYSTEDRVFNIFYILKSSSVTWIDDFVYFHQRHSNNAGSAESYRDAEVRIRTLAYVRERVLNCTASELNEKLAPLKLGDSLAVFNLLEQAREDKGFGGIRLIGRLLAENYPFRDLDFEGLRKVIRPWYSKIKVWLYQFWFGN